MLKTLRWLGRALLSLLTALLLVGVAIYAHHLFAGPPLKPWHSARLTAEFTAADYEHGRVTTLAQYREVEERVLDQVRERVSMRVDELDRLPYNRFQPGSLSDPNAWPVNWNKTFDLKPRGEMRGTVLLLHGLTGLFLII